MTNRRIWSAAFCLALTCFSARAHAFEQGGSNYTLYQTCPGDPLLLTGDYASCRSVIGDYHLDPVTVRTQLRSMCDNGQRLIALMPWFQHGTWMSDGHHGLLVDSSYEGFSPQVRANITNLVTDIATMTSNDGTACFTEIDFRFSRWGNWACGLTQPTGTQERATAETEMLENWSVISSTRALVEQAVANAGRTATLNTYYDLDAEGAGRDFCVANGATCSGDATSEYQKSIWWRYGQAYGHADAYISEATYTERTWRSVCVFDQAGARPSQYVFDVYPPGYPNHAPPYDLALFDEALAELAGAGEVGKPIMIQESPYHHDPDFTHELFAIAEYHGFPIRTIVQWVPPSGTVPYPQLFADNQRPVVLESGLGCSGNTCVWLKGAYFNPRNAFSATACSVHLYSPSWQYLGTATPVCYPRGGEVTFTIPPAYRSLAGLRVLVSNNISGMWNDPVWVPIH